MHQAAKNILSGEMYVRAMNDMGLRRRSQAIEACFIQMATRCKKE